MPRAARLLLGLLTVLPMAHEAVAMLVVPSGAGLSWLVLGRNAASGLAFALAVGFALHALLGQRAPPGGRGTWAAVCMAPFLILLNPATVTAALAGLEAAAGWGIHSPELGGDPVVAQHLAWARARPLLAGLSIAALSALPTYWRRFIWPAGSAVPTA